MLIKGVLKIGIAVKDLEHAGKVYTEQLGLDYKKGNNYPPLQMRYDLCWLGDSFMLQFIEPTGTGSIARFLDKNGEGLQHITFQVDGLDEAMSELKAKGVEFFPDEPVCLSPPEFGPVRFVFIPPRLFNGVLVQLMERIPA